MSDNSKFIEEAKGNAQRLSSELSDLSSFQVDSSEKFNQYKEKSQKIIELFKTLKPLLKDDRESLWNRFQEISNENRRKSEERKRNRISVSSRKKEIVLSTINDARGHASNGMDGFRRADDLLKQAHEQMKSGWDSGFNMLETLVHQSDGKMTKEDLEQCWQAWNEVKHLINSRRKELLSNNYHYVYDDLNRISDLAVYGDPYEAVKQIKITRSKLFSHPMERENKDSILNSLNHWWGKATERINQKKDERDRKQKEWEQKKAERERKQKEWEQRKVEREKKQREWEERKKEKERKQREWEERKIERERKQREWEERKRERDRKQREWEERKLERERERERKRQEWEDRQRERERRQQDWAERKQNRGSGRKKSSGGCYITTATCLTLGKPDDCFELMTIRQFRDNWLSLQNNGTQIIQDYYRLAPLIVRAINKYSDKKIIYQNVWEKYLNLFFQKIRQNKNEQAFIIYSRMVNDLERRFITYKCKS